MGESQLLSYKRTEVARWTQGPPHLTVLPPWPLEVPWGSCAAGGPRPLPCNVEVIPRCSATQVGAFPRCSANSVAGHVAPMFVFGASLSQPSPFPDKRKMPSRG